MVTRSGIWVSSALILLVSCLIAYGQYMAASDNFKGWRWTPASGPLWQLAMFCFFYSNFMSDVAFIRVFVIIANVLVTAWATFGCARWPCSWSSALAAFQLDGLSWCILAVLTAGIPMWRQFHFDDSSKEFQVKKRYAQAAEAMWREWFRRSGIPRADFKLIIEAGEFLEAPVDSVLPMFIEGPKTSGMSSTGGGRDEASLDNGNCNGHADGAFADCYYYIVDGNVRSQAHYAGGSQESTLRAGQFLDFVELLALFGQPSMATALQLQPLSARVALDSLYAEDGVAVPVDPMGAPPQRRLPGALVIRWSRTALFQKVLRSNGFAAQCMEMVLSQTTLDHLWARSLSPSHLPRYEQLEGKRREFHHAPLSKESAMQTRPLWKQFQMAHISLVDLWEPSPRLRAANASATGNREGVRKVLLKWRTEEVADHAPTGAK